MSDGTVIIEVELIYEKDPRKLTQVERANLIVEEQLRWTEFAKGMELKLKYKDVRHKIHVKSVYLGERRGRKAKPDSKRRRK